MSMEVSTIIQMLLVVFLIASAIGVSVTRNLFIAVIVFMGYSSIMAIIWVFLQSPDLAITEAAVGAGVDSVLFFLTLKKVQKCFFHVFQLNVIKSAEKGLGA